MANEGINGLIPTGNSPFVVDETIKIAQKTEKISTNVEDILTRVDSGFQEMHIDLGDVEGAVLGIDSDVTAINSNIAKISADMPYLKNQVDLIEDHSLSMKLALGTAQGIVPQTVTQMLYEIKEKVSKIAMKDDEFTIRPYPSGQLINNLITNGIYFVALNDNDPGMPEDTSNAANMILNVFCVTGPEESNGKFYTIAIQMAGIDNNEIKFRTGMGFAAYKIVHWSAWKRLPGA